MEEKCGKCKIREGEKRSNKKIFVVNWKSKMRMWSLEDVCWCIEGRINRLCLFIWFNLKLIINFVKDLLYFWCCVIINFFDILLDELDNWIL